MGRAGAGTGGGSHSGGGHSSSRSGSGHNMGNSRATGGDNSMGNHRDIGSNSSRVSMSGIRPDIQSNRRGSNTLDTINTVANIIDLAVDTADFVQEQREREKRRKERYGYMGVSNETRNTGNQNKPIKRGNLFAVIGIIFALFIVFILISSSSSSDMASSYNREKLDSNIAYSTNCIVDELGWFDSTNKTAKNLKYFYKKTGVQPYIVLHEYDSNLVSNKDKENWAYAYYDNNIDNECTFLYVYFAEKNDNDVGYMYCVNGKQIGSVMDSEAQDIFWGYIDKYWYGNGSTDDVFINAFKETADTIMTKSKTKADVIIMLLVVFGIIAVCITLFMVLKSKFKRDKEKAEETERILNTPLDELADDSDEILNKYQ